MLERCVVATGVEQFNEARIQDARFEEFMGGASFEQLVGGLALRFHNQLSREDVEDAVQEAMLHCTELIQSGRAHSGSQRGYAWRRSFDKTIDQFNASKKKWGEQSLDAQSGGGDRPLAERLESPGRSTRPEDSLVDRDYYGKLAEFVEGLDHSSATYRVLDMVFRAEGDSDALDEAIESSGMTKSAFSTNLSRALDQLEPYMLHLDEDRFGDLFAKRDRARAAGRARAAARRAENEPESGRPCDE